MLGRLSEYISSKYNLKCELNIDLKIYSDNVTDSILVSPVDDSILVKFRDHEIKSDKKMIYKDLCYLIDHLQFVYILSANEDLLHEMVYYADSDDTLIDTVEDFIWKNHNEMKIDHVFVLRFYGDYSFEALVSGSFIDTYWQIYDEAHYQATKAALDNFKYKDKDYPMKFKSIMSNVIASEYNLKFLRKYFLDLGYAFLLDYKDIDTHDVYQLIDIDFDSCKNICGDSYAIISADYKSMLCFYNGRYFIRGKILEEYPTIEKILQVDKEPCKYVHNLKTSRVLYDGALYEASGDTISDCLNALNSMLGGKILCCFTCKWGSYTTEEKDIYCMRGFNPRDFADILYMVDESKMIPYDQFNLCDDYEIPDMKNYAHTKYKAVK